MPFWSSMGQRILRAGKSGAEAVRSTVARRGGERSKNRRPRYVYEEPPAAELLNQQAVWARLEQGEAPAAALGLSSMVLRTAHVPRISVIVAVYEPVLRYFEATLISILSQTYGGYEIVIADNSLSTGVREVVNRYRDSRIRYYSVPGNRGDASLINDAARIAEGDYVAFAEVGDLLTKDALYQTALRIFQTRAEILYSDEDRSDPHGKRFDSPYRKPDYNKDYLLSCNYMKHFLVIRKELFLALRFREAYDGALEYDLLLRAPKSGISHIAKVLYHVTNASSEARAAGSIPGSSIAAGRSALEDYLRVRGIGANVSYSERRGIYRVDYRPGIFACRSDVGIIGGRVLNRSHKVTGGLMDSTGKMQYAGWDEAEGGPYNLALTRQNAMAVDIRCMKVRPDLQSLFEEMTGVPYKDAAFTEMSQEEILQRSLRLCGAVRDLGYLIVWDPAMITIC